MFYSTWDDALLDYSTEELYAIEEAWQEEKSDHLDTKLSKAKTELCSYDHKTTAVKENIKR